MTTAKIFDWKNTDSVFKQEANKNQSSTLGEAVQQLAQRMVDNSKAKVTPKQTQNTKNGVTTFTVKPSQNRSSAPLTKGPASVGAAFDEVKRRTQSPVPQVRSPRFNHSVLGRSRGFVGIPVDNNFDEKAAPSESSPFSNGAFRRQGSKFVTPIIGAGASADLTPIERAAGKNALSFNKGPLKSSGYDDETNAFIQKGIEKAAKDGYFGAELLGKGSVTSGTMRIDTHLFRDLNGREHETHKERNSTDIRHLLTNYLPQNKREYYYYLLGKEGKPAAEKYLDEIKINDMERSVMSSIAANRAERFADEHPVLSKAARVALGPAGAFEGAYNLLGSSIGRSDSSTMGDFEPSDVVSSAKRGYTAAEHRSIDRMTGGNPWLGTLLKSGNAGVNMVLDTLWLAPLGAVGKAAEGTAYASKILKGVHDAAIFTQMYNDEIGQQVASGTYGKQGSELSARFKSGLMGLSYGFITRGASAAVGKLAPGLTGMKKFLVNEASAAFSGGGVSFSQHLLGQAADIMLRGSYSDFQQTLKAYTDSGMSEEAAYRRAFNDIFVRGTVEATLTGALTSIVLGAHNSYRDAVQFNEYGKRVRAEGIDVFTNAFNQDPESPAYKNAERLMRKVEPSSEAGLGSAERFNSFDLSKFTDGELGAQAYLNDIEFMRTASFYFRMNDILGTIVKEGEVRDEQGRAGNAMISGTDITWNPESRNLKLRDVEHEYLHRALALAPETRSELSDILSGENFNKAIERRMNGLGLSRSEAAEEVYADLARTLPYTPDAIDRIERLAGNNLRLADRIYYGLKRLSADDTPTVTPSGDVFTSNELTAAQRIMEAGIAKAAQNYKAGAEADEDLNYSLVGRLPDGRGIYKTNYPANTPKAQKQNDLIDVVQNVWAEKPITLTLNDHGVPREIVANFDPQLSERSDLSKIVYGNKKGSGSEKRITLDLNSDLYQIAKDSRHTGSKDETGKSIITHDDVSQWHYFLTNLVYKGDDGKYIDGHMNIDVKQKSDGNYFYSFAFEKGTAPQALLAAVNESNSPTVPENIIPQPDSDVKNYSRDIPEVAPEVEMKVSDAASVSRTESGGNDTQTATKVLPYGIIPSDEVRSFVRGKTTDKYWRDEGRMRAVSLVNDAIAELDGGETELADEYLRQAADIVAEHTGVGDAAYSDFPAHITETFYNQLQTHLIEGLDPQSEADRNEFKCSVTSLVTGYARDLGLPHTFDTEPIAEKIREGYRASNINQGMVSIVDAAEMLAAAAGITDPDFVNNTAKQIQQYFINAQPASVLTPKERADKDLNEFATDIELKFRTLAYLSEGEVVAYAEAVRRNVRELLGSDPDIRAIRDDINKSLTDQFYGKGYTEFEKETITRGVVNNIRALYTQRVAYMKQELDQFIWEQRAKKDYDPDNPSAEIQRAETAKRLLDEKSNVVVPLLEQFEGGFIYSKTFLNTLQNPFNLSKDEMNARSDEFLYQQESNKGQYTLARSEIMRTGIRQSIELLKSKAVWDGTDTIKSLILENWLGRIGCHKEAVDLMVVHADRNRTSGRQIQANAVAKHMTATGRVMKFEQELDQAYFEQYKYLKGQEGADRFRDRLAEARRLDDEQRSNVARIMGEKSTVYHSLSSEAESLQKDVIDWTDDISGVLLEAEQTAERINALEAKFPQKNTEPEKPSAAAVLAENAARSEDRAREHDSVVRIMRRAGASNDFIIQLMKNNDGLLTAQDLAVYFPLKDLEPELDKPTTPEQLDKLISDLETLHKDLRLLDAERLRYENKITKASARIAFLNDEMADRVNAALVKIQEGEQLEMLDYDNLPKADLRKLETAEDKYLKHIGIRHFTTQERIQFRTTIFRIYDAKTPEDLIDTILDLSDRRHTAVQLKDRLFKNGGKNSTEGGHAKGGLYKKLMRVYEDFGVKEDDVAKYGSGADPKLDILKDIAIQQAFNSVTDRVKTSAAQKGRTAHFIAQLLGVPTFMGNILSEVLSGQVEGFTNNLATSLDIPVAAIQTIFQASTGKLKKDRNKKLNGKKVQRVVGYINTNRRFGYEVPVKGISKRLKAAAKRARESYLETALNVRLINRDRTALGKGTAYQRSFKKGVGASLERTLGYSLSVTDEHIKGYYAEAVRQSLKNSGLTPEEIEQEAKLQADYRVFQNDTLIGKILEDGRKVINHVGFGPEDERGFKPFGLGDFITTYTLVPAAIVTRNIEYSPLGALKALYLFGHMYNKAYGIAKADVAPEPMIPAMPYAKMMTDPAPLNNETSYGPEDDPYRTSDNKHKKGENVFETIRKSFGNINDHDYRAFMLALSRGLTGTALIGLAILLARLGIIMYSRKDSYNEDQLEKSKNTNGLVFNWSQAGRLIRGEADADKNHYEDTLMTFDWFAPVASNLSIGADIYNHLGEDGIKLNSSDFWSQTVKSSANVAPRSLENLSMWSSVNTLMHNWKNVNGDIPSLFAAEGADMVFSFMPSIFRQLSNAADDYQRDPYKASSVHELFWNKVRNNTPILRDGLKINGTEYVEGLPYKIDSFGQVVETTTGNKALDFFNYAISPSKIRRYKDNDLSDELTRLGEQDPGVVPTTPFREQKFDISGQEYKFNLSGKEYQEYAQMQGRLWYEVIHSFVDDPDYVRLSDSMKISILNDIKTDVVYNAAREIWVGYQSGKGESELTKIENDVLKKYRNAASDKIKNIQATDYLNQEGVNTEDVIDAGYYEPYTEAEKKEQVGQWREWVASYQNSLAKLNNGTFYNRALGGYSRNWSAAKRAEKIKEYQDKIESYQRSIEDVSSGAKQKWHKVTGAFSQLTDKEKAAVVSKMQREPDAIHLPDDVKNNKPDFSNAGPSVIDVSKPLVDQRNNSTLVGEFLDPTKWSTRSYDAMIRNERERYSRQDGTESSESGGTENDSATNGKNAYGSFSRSYKGFYRYKRKRRSYRRRSYSRRGGRKRRSSLPYINTSALGSGSYNKRGGLSRFANRFRGGGSSRFAGSAAFSSEGASGRIPTIGGDMRKRGWKY